MIGSSCRPPRRSLLALRPLDVVCLNSACQIQRNFSQQDRRFVTLPRKRAVPCLPLGSDESTRSIGIGCIGFLLRSEEHTSELQSLMRISYAVFCLKKKK